MSASAAEVAREKAEETKNDIPDAMKPDSK